MNPLKRTLRIYRVLNTCEKYRLDEENKKRDEKKKKHRKRRDELLLWEQEEEKTKTKDSETGDKDKKKDNDPLSRKAAKALREFYGKIILACIFLFVAGFIRGFFPKESVELAGTFQILYLMCAALIGIQSFLSIIIRLYKEENLTLMTTMPLNPLELVGAKLLQSLKPAYLIMVVGTLPFFMGCSVTAGLHGGLFLAVVLAVICIPIFLELLLFALVILLYSYTRLVVPRNPLVSISVPAAVVVLLGGIFVVLELLHPGLPTAKVLELLADILVFNLALKRITCGQKILPLIFIAMGMMATWLLFHYTVTRYYHSSVINRGDLAENREEKPVEIKNIVKVHGFRKAMVLRELRTVKGMRSYWSSNMLSYILVPLILLSADVILSGTLPVFFIDKSMSAARIFAGLVVYVMPMTILPSFLNKAAGTAFSRDAHYLDILFSMNLDVGELFCAKLFSTFLLCTLCTTPWLLLGGILLILSGMLPVWALLPALLLHLLLLCWVAEVKLMGDIRYMNKEWKKPKEFLKYRGSVPVGICLLVGVLIPLIIGLILELAVKVFWKSLAWVFFPTLLLVLIGYFDLFINGLEKLYELEEKREEDGGTGKKKGISRFLPN